MNGVLKPSGDRKVRSAKTQKNCYGLLHGPTGTCPQATVGEGGCSFIKPGAKNATCYVDGLTKVYKNINGVLKHNTDIMKSATLRNKQKILEAEFNRYEKAELASAKRANRQPWLNYRLHWAGDFFDAKYVKAAVRAMNNTPNLKFWTYTRSMFAVIPLSEVEHLSLYISLDIVNIGRGLDTYYKWKSEHNKHNNVQICYLSPSKKNDFASRWQSAYEAMGKPKYWDKEPPRLSTCPADVNKIPLEGACATCQKCLGTRQKLLPIWFCP